MTEKTNQAPAPAPYFKRETLELQQSKNLLLLLPENWKLFKDYDAWAIVHIDTEQEFKHITQHNYYEREYLIEFLLSYPFEGDEVEVERWRIQATRPYRCFRRETLELQTTENLLILLPENWHIFKDSGAWTIGHMDTAKQDFKHITQHDFDIREYLLEFLLSYPFAGDEVEVERWRLRTTRPAAPTKPASL